MKKLKNKFPEIIFENISQFTIIRIDKENIKELIKVLKENYLYDSLMDIMCADYPDEEQRFEITYNILNISNNKRLLVKTKSTKEIDTIEEIFPSSQWYERENYDLFGIVFGKNTQRILNEENFDGHPLRKDFPLSGYKEFFYNIESDSVSQRPTQLEQEYRMFKTVSAWENIDIIELDRNDNN